MDQAGKALEGASTAFTRFTNLLKDFNVVGFVLGMLIANSVQEMANSFISGVLMPSLTPLLKKISDKGTTVKIGGLVLHLDKFINALMKFLALSVVIFVLIQFGVKMNKPVQWVRVQQINPDAKTEIVNALAEGNLSITRK